MSLLKRTYMCQLCSHLPICIENHVKARGKVLVNIIYRSQICKWISLGTMIPTHIIPTHHCGGSCKTSYNMIGVHDCIVSFSWPLKRGVTCVQCAYYSNIIVVHRIVSNTRCIINYNKYIMMCVVIRNKVSRIFTSESVISRGWMRILNYCQCYCFTSRNLAIYYTQFNIDLMIL